MLKQCCLCSDLFKKKNSVAKLFGGACLAALHRINAKRDDHVVALHKVLVILAQQPSGFQFRRQFAFRLLYGLEPEFGPKSLAVFLEQVKLFEFSCGEASCACKGTGCTVDPPFAPSAAGVKFAVQVEQARCTGDKADGSGDTKDGKHAIEF